LAHLEMLLGGVENKSSAQRSSHFRASRLLGFGRAWLRRGGGSWRFPCGGGPWRGLRLRRRGGSLLPRGQQATIFQAGRERGTSGTPMNLVNLVNLGESHTNSPSVWIHGLLEGGGLVNHGTEPPGYPTELFWNALGTSSRSPTTPAPRPIPGNGPAATWASAALTARPRHAGRCPRRVVPGSRGPRGAWGRSTGRPSRPVRRRPGRPLLGGERG
jgi:hypothetical protein